MSTSQSYLDPTQSNEWELAFGSISTPLFKLPNEAIFEIVDHVQARNPYDIEALALCCKHLYSILTNKIRVHNQKRERYADPILLGWENLLIRADGSYQDANIHPIQDLHEIVKDVDKRLYTKVLHLGDAGEDFETSDPAAKDALIDSFTSEFGDHITTWIAKIYKTILPTGEQSGAEKWSDEIKEGLPSAIFVLLIAICPNLTTLVTCHRGQLWHEDQETILGALTATARNPETNTLEILKDLSELGLKGVGDELGSAPGELLNLFMPLPSMDSVWGYWIAGCSNLWPYETATSNVTELSLKCSDMDMQSLTELLRGTRGVQSFCYTHFQDVEHREVYGWPPTGQIQIAPALRVYAAHSLIRLELGCEDYDGTIDPQDSSFFIGDLSSFTILSIVKIDFAMLFRRGTPQRLIDILPASLELLTIVLSSKGTWANRRSSPPSTVSGLTKENIAVMFGGLAESKSKWLPRLCSICVESREIIADQTMKELSELRRQCSISGVEIEIWKRK